MRSIEEVRAVLALAQEGLNDCEIARRTRVPRETVRDWRHGKMPRRSRGEADETCNECGHPKHDFLSLPRDDYPYLFALYLGDGTLSASRRKVFKLRITLDERYPRIIESCARAVRSVCPSSKVNVARRVGCMEVYSYSRIWPCLFPQHGPGKKHLRKIELTQWQEQLIQANPEPLIRGLIHSDGGHHANMIKHPDKTYTYYRYEFTNMSADIKAIFCSACDLLGIRWRVMNAKTISIARRESVALMDQFVGPKF